MKNSKSLLKIMLVSALTLGVGSYSFLAPMHSAQAQSVMESMGAGTIDWTQGSVKVTGSGAPPAGGSAAQKRLMSRRAAIADAYRQLAEMINGVRVDSETVVQNFVTESDTIKTQVSALIKGATVTDTRYLSDGSVEVDMVAGLYGPNSLSSVMQPSIFKKRNITTRTTSHTETHTTTTTTPPETPPSTPPETPTTMPNTSGKYTGVVVDCRGLGVKPAMSPAIVDVGGKEVYIGKRAIDPDVVVNQGIVGYSRSLDAARSHKRVGSAPLIIKATKAGGRMKADAVLTADAANQLMQADGGSHFLDDSKVVFLID